MMERDLQESSNGSPMSQRNRSNSNYPNSNHSNSNHVKKNRSINQTDKIFHSLIKNAHSSKLPKMQKLVNPVVNALDLMLQNIRDKIETSYEREKNLSTNEYKTDRLWQNGRVKKKKTMPKKAGYFVPEIPGTKGGLRHYDTYDVRHNRADNENSLENSEPSANFDRGEGRKETAEGALLRLQAMGPLGKTEDDPPQGQMSKSDLLKEVMKINQQRSRNFTNP